VHETIVITTRSETTIASLCWLLIVLIEIYKSRTPAIIDQDKFYTMILHVRCIVGARVARRNILLIIFIEIYGSESLRC
jgi:hypothetical protein